MIGEAVVRQGREGSRWYNQRPTSEEVAEWFSGVPLHEGMSHSGYVGGVTLIPQQEKNVRDVVGLDADNAPIIVERDHLVWTPYMRVDTRIAYFWELMRVNGWIGRIEPVEQTGDTSLGLPPGFFKYAAVNPAGKTETFIGASMQATVRESMLGTTQLGRIVMAPPPGTKIVSTQTRYAADPHALMKAETGAVGRALGMAGMLVIGSGVATAEDMQEFLGGLPTEAAPAPVLPPVAPATAVEVSDDELRTQAGELVKALGEKSPAQLEAFREWAKGRKITLASAQGLALKGVVRKLQKLVDDS